MLWLLFLSQSVFAADSIVTDVRCAEAPKSFKISEAKSQFQEISIIKGQQIRIKARSPNEDIMIDCRELMTPAKAEAQSWNGLKQEVKIGFWDKVILPVAILKLSKSEITLTNKNDFPVFSKIFVKQTKKRTELTLTQSPWTKGDGIKIQCPSTERSSHFEPIKVSVYKSGELSGSYSLEDKQIRKPILPDGSENVVCNEERYSVSLSEGRLQAVTADPGIPASTTGEAVK
jgi:hypothetical protein